MAELNDGFVEVGGGDAWAPEAAGDSITGVYVSTKEDVGPNQSKMHNLRTADGIVGVWGSTVLDDKFESVNVGDIVRVTYTGLSKDKGKFGKPWKTWKLESKPNPNPAGAAPEAPVQDANINDQGEIDLSGLDY